MIWKSFVTNWHVICPTCDTSAQCTVWNSGGSLGYNLQWETSSWYFVNNCPTDLEFSSWVWTILLADWIKIPLYATVLFVKLPFLSHKAKLTLFTSMWVERLVFTVHCGEKDRKYLQPQSILLWPALVVVKHWWKHTLVGSQNTGSLYSIIEGNRNNIISFLPVPPVFRVSININWELSDQSLTELWAKEKNRGCNQHFSRKMKQYDKTFLKC